MARVWHLRNGKAFPPVWGKNPLEQAKQCTTLPLMRETSDANTPKTTLRLLATSDVHMHLTGWDPRTDNTAMDCGFDRIAAVIRKARAEASGPVILMDNGDGLQGAPHGETAQKLDGPHPWPALLNAAGYDALGLGNHDFDYGLDALEAFGAAADAPLVSASPNRPLRRVEPYVIIERVLPGAHGALKIGITSVLPPQTEIWASGQLHGRLGFHDGITAASRAVAALRDAGADIVVVLCHSGLTGTSAQDDENFARALARTVPGVDAMILGHTHEQFPDAAHGHLDGVDPTDGTLFGVPAAMPGYAAAFLAQIDLHLVKEDDVWRVTDHAVCLRAPDPDLRDTDATRLAAPCLAATRARIQEVVGQSDHSFHSYFAMLQSGTPDAIFARAMQQAVQEAIAETDLADLPVLAATAPYAAGGRAGPDNYLVAHKGDILARHVSLINPFQNTVCAHRMTGTEVRAYLETSLKFFGPEKTGGTPLVSKGAPAFNFDTLNGLYMTVDAFAPAGRRVASLTCDGRPVSSEDSFLVAMTSYRGAGGGGFPGTGVPFAVETDVPASMAIRSYLAARTVCADHAASVWSFASGATASVLIETSPRAALHLDEIASFQPEPLGLTQEGFLQIRVTL